MKNKHNGGFSLIETLVAIAVLGIITVPTCNALITSYRLNQSADTMLQAQLSVSSAVETMMAEGIQPQYVPDTSDDTKDGENYGWENGSDNFSDVTVVLEKAFDGVCQKSCGCANGDCYTKVGGCDACNDNGAYSCDIPQYYKVVATSTVNTSVSVTTYIRTASNNAASPAAAAITPLSGGDPS